MEQTPHSSGSTPELPSVPQQASGEFIDTSRSPELQVVGPVERQEQRSEAASVASQTFSPSPQLPTPAVAVSTSDDSSLATQASDDDLPSIAGDDDLIEKEWVAKTKKVLAETKDDPYRREQEVGRIQQDYLLKRYGRELGSGGGR